jgi:caspase domain-containing protein
MCKSPARKRFAVVLLVAAWLSSLPSYAQKPQQKRAKQARGVRDDQVAPAPPLSLGPYYALIIGNNNYRYLEKLQTAVNDATAMANLLQGQYGFKERRLLLNATRDDIFEALTDYRRTLPENSNLLIYYAGHGYHDRDTDEAYWLPVDAQKGNPDHWISANDITTNIRAIPSKHVLVISDSCYSGVLTRDADVSIRPREPRTYLLKMLGSKSRNLMSSGGDEPVVDSGSEGHSVFAGAVLKYLKEMEDEQFTAADLFPRIRRGVAGRSAQVPQYNYIRNSGDEFGDFVFSRGGRGVVNNSGAGGVNGGHEPPKKYGGGAQSRWLPGIACEKESDLGGLGPKIRQGDLVPCKLLDEPLQWLKPYELPKLPKPPAQTKWTAMLTITVDEDGHLIDVKPRGGSSLQGMESVLKSAAQLWQTNSPTYRGKRVKSSFALDIDFGQ